VGAGWQNLCFKINQSVSLKIKVDLTRQPIAFIGQLEKLRWLDYSTSKKKPKKKFQRKKTYSLES
jgi:hypothetical protein